MDVVKEIKKEIVVVAEKYLGVKEIPPNQGFYNKAFEARARRAGFVKGYAWCMIACKVIVTEAIENIQERLGIDLSLAGAEIEKKITPSTIYTWGNFRQSLYWERVEKPQAGDIVIFVNTHSRGTGHAGIVCRVHPNGYFESVEGNSNTTGSREGTEMVRKTRLATDTDGKGLDVLGFVRLKKIA